MTVIMTTIRLFILVYIYSGQRYKIIKRFDLSFVTFVTFFFCNNSNDISFAIIVFYFLINEQWVINLGYIFYFLF